MVDTIHMHIEEASPVQPILDCGSELRHVHLCESNGALFGTGQVNFPKVLEALKQIHYNRFASIKVYRRPFDEGAETAMDHLKRF